MIFNPVLLRVSNYQIWNVLRYATRAEQAYITLSLNQFYFWMAAYVHLHFKLSSVSKSQYATEP
jgi:hypothetical protein